MNKKLGMAVAGAVMAFGASAANAGITIPAGDWTIDIGGNVNAFYTYNKGDDAAQSVVGGIAANASTGQDNATNINTGLLPSAIGIGGKTRQNDLDIAFQFTFFPGVSSDRSVVGGATDSAFGTNSLNIRQVYLTFGDASWGSIKVGRDLGIFGSDAILNDQTLLGVGGLGQGSGTTTLGRIGTGFIYADWNAQISYMSPNWNGFSFKAGVFDPWDSIGLSVVGTPGTVPIGGTAKESSPQFQGQLAYEWTGDVSGKVWTGFITQDFDSADRAKGWELGGKVGFSGLTLVGYYYDADSVGTTGFGVGAHDANGNGRDSDGWYVQAAYVLPTIGTKIAASYGESKLDKASGEADSLNLEENNMWTVGVYHPLTKSLNLVAEYNNVESKAHNGVDNESDSVSFGAIMFF